MTIVYLEMVTTKNEHTHANTARVFNISAKQYSGNLLQGLHLIMHGTNGLYRTPNHNPIRSSNNPLPESPTYSPLVQYTIKCRDHSFPWQIFPNSADQFVKFRGSPRQIFDTR